VLKRHIEIMKAGDIADLLGDVPTLETNGPAYVDPDGYKIVSIRLRQAEFACFSQQARSLGLTHNLALRIAARRISGFLEIDAETRRLLRQVSSNIGEIALNISRLRRLAEQADSIDIERLEEQRKGFGREFAVLDDRLQTLLNISQRRIDGRMMLQDAADS
jgi:type IV secretion system T-DNA border endonuclease VirD1